VLFLRFSTKLKRNFEATNGKRLGTRQSIHPRVPDAMPADKYSFRAVDSIRSFAEQMLHLAFSNVVLAGTGTGVQNIFLTRKLEKSPTAQTKILLCTM
jgi:hypothetical protein